jgi:hypothetical protein
MKSERALQLSLSKTSVVGSLAISLPILAMAAWHNGQPDRHPLPDRIVYGRAVAIAVGPTLRMWELSSPDPRFGGVSALAVHSDRLIALTDSGTVVRFAPPGTSEQLEVALHDLPGGPGSPLRKAGRDSESLLADRDGRGWWVGFEHRHSLWLFDREFRRVLAKRSLKVDWTPNKGGESLVQGTTGIMVLPEGGGRVAGGETLAPAWNSDATRLRDGRIVLLIRRPGWTGFDNQLWIGPGAGRGERRIKLDVGALDNMEGIAAAPLPNGGTRLWIISDNNFKPWLRTLLVAFDLGPKD